MSTPEADEPYYSDYETKPIGGGNPYHACAHCGISDPQINGRLEGHAEDCVYRLKKQAEIAEYEALPEETKLRMRLEKANQLILLQSTRINNLLTDLLEAQKRAMELAARLRKYEPGAVAFPSPATQSQS